MALPQVPRTATFETWRNSTNDISTNVGDPASLTTTAKSSLVNATNELKGNVGTMSLTTFAASNITAALVELKTGNNVTISGTKTFEENVNTATGKAFTINGVSVLNATTLGSSVTGSSLTSVGIIGSGTWQGVVIGPTYGGTGFNNGSRTIKLNTGSLELTAQSGGSNVTVPASGTLATLDGTETLTNKSLQDSTTFIIDETDATKKLQLQVSSISTGTTRTLTVPDRSGTIATAGTLSTFGSNNISDLGGASLVSTTATQGLTNKTIALASNTITGDLNAFNTALSDDDFAALAAVQTLTNKSLVDSSTYIVDNGDVTKRVQFEVSGISTNTTRALTVPNASGTLLLADATQTLTNKSLVDATTLIIDDADNTKKFKFEASSIGTGTTHTLTVQNSTGTIALLGNNLGQFAATTAAQFGSVFAAGEKTGSGLVVFQTSPTLTSPTLGAALATSINKVAITAPASGSTLTIADGKTLSVNNTLTFTGTDTSSVAFGAGGTVVYTSNHLGQLATTTAAQFAGVFAAGEKTGTGLVVFQTSPTLVSPALGSATATSINKVAITAPATAATLTIANNKTLTVNNTLTFTGTDTSSVAFGNGGTVIYAANTIADMGTFASSDLLGKLTDETGTGLVVFNTSPSLITPTIGGGGATFSGSTSGTTVFKAAAAAGTTTITMPATTGTVALVSDIGTGSLSLSTGEGIVSATASFSANQASGSTSYSVAHAIPSGAAAGTLGGNGIASIITDKFGHVTAVTTATYLTSSTGVSSIAGTTNQVNVTASTGAVTLSTPQNIHNAATPTFAGLTLNGAASANVYTQNSTVAPNVTTPKLPTGSTVLSLANSNAYYDGTSSTIEGIVVNKSQTRFYVDSHGNVTINGNLTVVGNTTISSTTYSPAWSTVSGKTYYGSIKADSGTDATPGDGTALKFTGSGGIATSVANGAGAADDTVTITWTPGAANRLTFGTGIGGFETATPANPATTFDASKGITITNGGVIELTQGGGIAITGTKANYTIAHGATSSVANLTATANTFIAAETYDGYGHVLTRTAAAVDFNVADNYAFKVVAITADSGYTWPSANAASTQTAESNTDTLNLVPGQGIELFGSTAAATDAVKIGHVSGTLAAGQVAYGNVIGNITVDAMGHVTAVSTATQAHSTVYAGPAWTSGNAPANAAPTFRSLVSNDIPSLLATKISDFDTQVRSSRLDQMAVPTGSVNLNGQKIISLATPTATTDAATKGYVDSLAQGLDVKASVRAATTAAIGNITLSGNQTIDGVALVDGNRILVKNQTAATANGIYVVASGAWTRAEDADAWTELPSAFVFVEEGTVNADTGWTCTSNAGGTLGTTAVTWTQFSGAGTYSAGTGLTLSGTTFSVAANTYQPLDGDLTAIAALSGTSGFLKKTNTDTWSLDTNTYLTAEADTLASVTGRAGGALTDTASTFTAGITVGKIGTAGKVSFVGSTSGTTILTAPAAAGSGVITIPAATGVMALTSDIGTGALNVSVDASPAASGVALQWGTATGFNANSAAGTTTTYNLKLGPAIGDLAQKMANAPAAGFLKKTAADTFAIDTNTYLTSAITSINSQTGPAITIDSGSGLSVTQPVANTIRVSFGSTYGDTVNPYGSKAQNLVLATPNGAAGVPTFRSLVNADLPTVDVAHGGTGATTFTAGYLKANGTNAFSTVSTIPYSDILSPPTIGDSELAVSISLTAATSGQALQWGTTSGFTANRSTGNITYDLRVGPALSNYAAAMSGANNYGFLKKTGADTVIKTYDLSGGSVDSIGFVFQSYSSANMWTVLHAGDPAGLTELYLPSGSGTLARTSDISNHQITIQGGTGMSGGGSFGLNQGFIQTITLTNSDPGSSQNIFKNVAVTAGTGYASGTDCVADSNNDTLTLKANSGISLVSVPSTDTIEISNTGVLQVQTIGSNDGGYSDNSANTNFNGVVPLYGVQNRVKLTYTTGAGYARVEFSTPQDINTSSSVRFGSLGIGTPAGAAGEIRATDNITAYYTSDERLKTNVRPIENALDKVSQLDGVIYDWNDTYKKDHGDVDGYFVRADNSGVIAQQVEKVFPNVVADRADGFKAVRYELLVPLLIEAIKDLKAEIESLKAQK